MNQYSIRQKVIFVVTIFVVFTALFVGGISIYTAKNTIETRVLNSELPSTINAVANEINSEIAQMQVIAQQIATDPLLLDWMTNGADKSIETLVTQKLASIAENNNLSGASIADRESANYWNQDGFLRTLESGSADAWFFEYKTSNQAYMSSVYRDTNTGKTDLFVNYQQLNGRGLAGTSKSFKAVVDMLHGYRFEQTGIVYLVDKEGLVQLHANSQTIGQSLNQFMQGLNKSDLLQENSFEHTIVEINGEKTLVAATFIPAMQWFVIAQVPHSEMFESINALAWQIALVSLLIIALAFGVALVLSKSITRPIMKLEDVFTRLGKGNADLSYRLPTSGQKEFKTIALGYNEFVAKLESMFSEIAATSVELGSVADLLKNDAMNALSRVEVNAQSTGAISMSLAQVNENSKIASSAAQQAAEVSSKLNDDGIIVAQTISQTQQDINNLAHKINDVSRVIQSLTTNTETIAGVLQVIEGISEQTNLLALNAAIEAARAGEQGRGFAVVADEVRNLAKRTAESTKEVQNIMEQLKTTSASATTEIDLITEQSRATAESIISAEKTLSENASQFSEISVTNNAICESAKVQSNQIDEISLSMSRVRENAENNLSNIKQIADETKTLNRLSSKLAHMVASNSK